MLRGIARAGRVRVHHWTSLVTGSRWYPRSIRAGGFGGEFDSETISFLNSDDCDLSTANRAGLCIAEFGIWKGATSLHLAKFLGGQGELHIFDYEDNVQSVAESLRGEGYTNVRTWGSSYKYLDSYNWCLMKVLEENTQPVFDYVYLDGAHTWAVDALTFFLCDRLLKPGGYLDFDDYDWRIRGSGVDPKRAPVMRRLYTDEQMDSYQVQMIVDLLVKRDTSYTEVRANKIFRKA